MSDPSGSPPPMPVPGSALPLSEPRHVTPAGAAAQVGLRRRLLLLAARLQPEVTAQWLARRYLSAATWLDLDHLHRRSSSAVVALGEDAAIVRFAALEARARILLVHGHEGHVRQFSRMIRALLKAGVSVDALVLPGHLHRGAGLCSMAEIVGAIGRSVTEQGPYDGVVAHCVGASGLLFAMAEGVSAPRVVLISTPLEILKLVRFGGRQYGIGGTCLDRFVIEVSLLGAPYTLETPWRDLVAARTEACLAVHACDDYAAPVGDMAGLAEAWPGARLLVFEQGDHNSIVALAGAIAAIVDFLTGPPGPDA